ncbi:MAG: hypothetical protein ACI9Y1_003176 [Lentisphaeria bacterium]|jgi:hypothetical protein
MAKKYKLLGVDEPLYQPDHPRPRTRREFLAQGFTASFGTVVGGTVLGSLLGSSKVAAAVPQEIIDACNIGGGTRKVPFIGIDLAGGASVCGSNVLLGGQGGQMDFLSDGGYARLGIPSDMAPGVLEANGPGSSETGTSNGDHTDTTFGLAFHSDSGILRGMLSKASPECAAFTNGFVMAARSENDTGNNPHNPTYGLNLVAGVKGDILYAASSRNNDTGGANSRIPTKFMAFDQYRPTKIDRGNDVLGLVKVGDFNGLTNDEVVAAMTSVWEMSKAKIDKMDPRLVDTELNAAVKRKLQCVYAETAHLAKEYPDSRVLNIEEDAFLKDIFPSDELNDGTFETAASIMKVVIGGTGGSASGYSGVGTMSMGGYDYHGNGRENQEARDFRAGQVIGACLEYAHRTGVPLMIAEWSDGGISHNGTVGARGKFDPSSDNSNTRAQFVLVYDPLGRPTLREPANQQIGYMRADGNVETNSWPGANNAETTADCLIANYMALHGLEGQFTSTYSSNGLSQSLGSGTQLDRYLAFTRLPSVGVDGEVTSSRPSSDIILGLP